MAAVKIKDPNAPATDAQRNFLLKLAAERNIEVDEAALATATKGEVSERIDVLLQMPKAGMPAKADLAAVAKHGVAALKPQQAAMKVAADAGTLAITEAEAKTILSWAGIADAEVGLDAAEEKLAELLRQFIAKPSPAAQADAEAAHGLPAIPDGHYAVTGNDGTTDFYRVKNGKAESKWAGFVFVDQQLSDDFVPVKSFPVKKSILAKIADQGVLESAKRYGVELGVCGVCHKTLTDPESIAAGIGPVCAAKLGG